MYDLIIIGTGAAGYTAAIYASRYELNTFLIGEKPGGSASDAYEVENWPGEIKISGYDLMQKFANHAKHFKVPIKNEIAKHLVKNDNQFKVITDQNEYQAKTLILALGTKRRKLHILGESEFLGKGVSYCATCDGAFFRGKTVMVVGGGNAGFMAATQLAQIAKKVYVTFIEGQPMAQPAVVSNAQKNENVEFIPKNTIKEIKGDNLVKSVKLQEKYQGKQKLPIDGVFVEIGAMPNSVLTKDLGINTTNNGYIEVKSNQETNIAGIFAAGDITTESAGFSQIITASAEGAIAAYAAFKYLRK